MKEHTSLIETWPHCQRDDMKNALDKGPLVYRILAVSETLATLEQEETQVRDRIRSLKLTLRAAADLCSYEEKQPLVIELRSLQIELDRILTLQERTRQTLPEIAIVTDKDVRHTRAKAECTYTQTGHPFAQSANAKAANLGDRDCA